MLRFLFTIKEESREDLESEDGRSRISNCRSFNIGSPLPSPAFRASNPWSGGEAMTEAEMDSVNIKAYYGGQWNGRRYEDGNEVEFSWPESDLTYYGLRYMVARNCYLVGSDFDMFYFSISESTGRTRKSKLRSDEQVVEPCTKHLSPEVYVIIKNGGSPSHVGASSSHVGGSSSYIPQFDPSYQEPSLFEFGNTYGNTKDFRSQLDDIVKNINSTDWDEQVYQVHNLEGSSSRRAANVRDDFVYQGQFSCEKLESEPFRSLFFFGVSKPSDRWCFRGFHRRILGVRGSGADLCTSEYSVSMIEVHAEFGKQDTGPMRKMMEDK